MNTLYKFSFLLFLSFYSYQSFAQKDTTLIVNGVCGMCQYTIETAVYEVNGVAEAHWDVETKVLSVSFDPGKTDLQTINEAVNASGYDTEYTTGNNEAYAELNPCCHYRDPKVVDDHKSK